METKEGNKLIAGFMGFVQGGLLNEYTNPSDKGKDGWVKIYNPDGSGFKYDISWDWLMPVIKKIKKWSIPDKLWEDYTLHWGQIRDELISLNINNVWNAAIKFIEWYNKKEKDV